MRSRRFGVRSRAAVASLALLAAACGSGAGAEGAGNGDCTPAQGAGPHLRRLQHTREVYAIAAAAAPTTSTDLNVNLSTEALNGTWRLRVNDNANADTGYINSWSITF